MKDCYFTQNEHHPIFDRDEYYQERFAYEAECERMDEEEESDEWNEHGFANAEDYWKERI